LNLWVEEIFAASLVRRDDNAKLNFIAAIENSDRALMRSGNGNGRKIQLRVPESEVGNAIELEGWAQKTFIVTLRVLNEKERIEFEAGQKSAAQKGGIGNGSGIATPRRTSAKRRERSSD
jgi:hypothetical protein